MPGEKTFRQQMATWAQEHAKTQHNARACGHWLDEAARRHEAEVAGLRARVEELQQGVYESGPYQQAAAENERLQKRIEELEAQAAEFYADHEEQATAAQGRIAGLDADVSRLREALEQIKALYRDWDSDQSTYYPSELAREMAQISNRALAPQGGEAPEQILQRARLTPTCDWFGRDADCHPNCGGHRCGKVMPCPDHPKQEEGK